MTDEKILIGQILSGDQDAFAQLVQQYQKPVYNLCLRMVSNPTDAEDLAQEAFVKAWRGLRFYKHEAAFSTWLYRLTANVCIDFLRKQKRKNTVSLTEEDAQELEVPDAEPMPEEQLLHREKQQAVSAAMVQLDEDYRLVMTLRVVEELSYEQIAEVLDIKVGTVKSRLARARERLRKILLQNGNIFGNISSKESERGRNHEV